MLLSASPSHNVHAACLPVCKGGADFGVAVAKHKEPTFRNILWPQLYFARRGRGVEGFCFGPGSPGAPANKNAACSLWRGFLFQMIFMVPHELCGTNAIITLITDLHGTSWTLWYQCYHYIDNIYFKAILCSCLTVTTEEHTHCLEIC